MSITKALLGTAKKTTDARRNRKQCQERTGRGAKFCMRPIRGAAETCGRIACVNAHYMRTDN